MGGVSSGADRVTQLLAEFRGLIRSAASIEGRCRTKCEEEVEELGTYVRGIFHEFARRRPTTASASNTQQAPPPAPEDSGRKVVEFSRADGEETNVPKAPGGRENTP